MGDLNLSVFDEVIVTSDNGDLYNCCLWDLQNGSLIEPFHDGNSSANCLCAIGNDYLMSSIKGTNVIKVWPRSENMHAGGIDIICPDRVTALDCSFSSTYCVGAINCKLYLWQISTGKLMCILSAHNNDVKKVKFTSDERYIISSANDMYLFAWKISDIINADENSKKLNPSHTWKFYPNGVVDFTIPYFGSENKVMAITSSQCKIYSIETGDIIMEINLKNDSLCTCVGTDVMGDFAFLGKANGFVYQIELDFIPKEKMHHKTKDTSIKKLHLHKSTVTCLSTSKDGYLISGSVDKTVVIWDIVTAQVIRVFEHSGAVTNAFFIQAQSTYQKYPPKIVKQFRFDVSSFNIDTWKVELQPLDETTMDWDAKVYGNLKLMEKLKVGESSQSESKQLTEKQVFNTEFTNEMMFSYGYLIDFH